MRCLLIVAAIIEVSRAFSPLHLLPPLRHPSRTTPSVVAVVVGDGRASLFPSLPAPLRAAAADGGGDDGPSSSSSSSSVSLAEKMRSWEASEDEIRAATLGGVVPGTRIGAGGTEGGGRTDAFDVGLYIAFPIMVLSCLAFVFFPLLVGNIDITSVGPPPTS